MKQRGKKRRWYLSSTLWYSNFHSLLATPCLFKVFFTIGQELSKVSHIDYFHFIGKYSPGLHSSVHSFSPPWCIFRVGNKDAHLSSLSVPWDINGQSRIWDFLSLSQSTRSLTGDLSGSWCQQNRGIIIRILGRNAFSLRKQGLTAGWESPEVSCLCPLCEGLSLKAKIHGTKWQIKLSGLHCLHLREQPEVLLGSLERGALAQLRLSTHAWSNQLWSGYQNHAAQNERWGLSVVFHVAGEEK